jgi:KDO2-lipid IV(A) lauroyltransferase
MDEAIEFSKEVAENVSKKYNLPVAYGSINKEKRGHFSLDISILCESPQDTEEGEITALHTRTLEKKILEQPEYWLWTHKRWKRKRKENE